MLNRELENSRSRLNGDGQSGPLPIYIHLFDSALTDLASAAEGIDCKETSFMISNRLLIWSNVETR